MTRRRAPGTPDQDLWTSPSELADWRRCQRRWAFYWLHKLPQQETTATLLGRELDQLAAGYLEEGIAPDLELRRSWSWTGDSTTYYPGRTLKAMLPLLPAPRTGAYEAEAFLELGNHKVKILPDWSRKGEVVDLKTIGNLRNKISRPALRRAPAALLYGLENARTHRAREVELRWIFGTRGAPYSARETAIRMTRAELEDGAAALLPELEALLDAKRRALPVEILPRSPKSCFVCPYRVACENADHLSRAAVRPTGDSLASIVEDFKADQEEQAPSLSGLLEELRAATFGGDAELEAEPDQPKAKAKGWRPPPASSRWSDLYRTREGKITDSLRLCQETLGEVRRGETVHVISDGSWSMDEPIVHLAELAGPCDLYVATWSVSMVCALRLAEATRLGWIRELRVIVDERIKINRPEVLDVLQIASGAGNIGTMPCHMKAYTLRAVAPDGPAWTLVGSANLNRNPRPEALVIQEGRELSDFYVGWIAQQLDSARALEYRSTFGPARRRALELMGREDEEHHGEEESQNQEGSPADTA